jgi:cell division protein FtsB
MTRFQQILTLSLAFFVFLMLAALFHDDGILTVFKLQDQMAEIRESNKALSAKNANIHKEIEALKSNPLAIEKIAREKLNLVKPGETVYQIVRKNSSP